MKKMRWLFSTTPQNIKEKFSSLMLVRLGLMLLLRAVWGGYKPTTELGTSKTIKNFRRPAFKLDQALVTTTNSPSARQ